MTRTQYSVETTMAPIQISDCRTSKGSLNFLLTFIRVLSNKRGCFFIKKWFWCLHFVYGEYVYGIVRKFLKSMIFWALPEHYEDPIFTKKLEQISEIKTSQKAVWKILNKKIAFFRRALACKISTYWHRRHR